MAEYITSWIRWRRRSKILYIESFARTRKLSLTGRIMTFLSDRFLVQWPKLASKQGEYYGKQREYHGILL